jgi:DNA-directed RNA polymerase beta subunit
LTSFYHAVNNQALERELEKAITVGQEATSPINPTGKKLSMTTQRLDRKNPLHVLAVIRSIHTSNSSQSKLTDRAYEMRAVHPTYTGYIDPVASPDTGENVGLAKQPGCTVIVSIASSSTLLTHILLEDEEYKIITPDNLKNYSELLYLGKIFINGKPIGYHKECHNIAFYYRKLRREGKIDRNISIVWDPDTDELHFWTDYGRLLRPLMIVDNNLRLNKSEEEFEQKLLLTEEDIDLLKKDKLTVSELINQGKIEMISTDEIINCVVAYSYDCLNTAKTNRSILYTHCELEQAILGVTVLTAPYGNHSNATRLTYQSNQSKATGGWFALNFPFRYDKHAFFQTEIEMPLTKTFINNTGYPNGYNVILALDCNMKGTTIEDGITISKEFIDRGGFAGCSYNFKTAELEIGERFKKPDPLTTLDLKYNSSYDKITNDGFPIIGKVYSKGDIILGVVAERSSLLENPEYKFICRSYKYTDQEPAKIVSYIVDKKPNGNPFCKIKFQSYRKIVIGDKMSTRHGNKGVCSYIAQSSDLFQTISGLKIDISVNPHCIPSRMLVGQLLEGLTSKVAALQGTIVDGSIFTKVNLDEYFAELRSFGLEQHGLEKVINGETGEVMDAMIFIAPCYYQRIKKFVIEESNAAIGGNLNVITRQGTSGNSFKIGEYEVWALTANGAMSCLDEKLKHDADMFSVYICTNCNKYAIYNERENVYKCNNCKELANISLVNSTWTAKSFVDTFKAMGVDVELHTDDIIQEI